MMYGAAPQTLQSLCTNTDIGVLLQLWAGLAQQPSRQTNMRSQRGHRMCRAASDTVPIVLADDLQKGQQRRQKRCFCQLRRSPSPAAGNSECEASAIDSIVASGPCAELAVARRSAKHPVVPLPLGGACWRRTPSRTRRPTTGAVILVAHSLQRVSDTLSRPADQSHTVLVLKG